MGQGNAGHGQEMKNIFPCNTHKPAEGLAMNESQKTGRIEARRGDTFRYMQMHADCGVRVQLWCQLVFDEKVV